MLQRYVRGRVPTDEDAEDIVQEKLYQFLRTIHVLRDKYNFQKY